MPFKMKNDNHTYYLFPTYVLMDMYILFSHIYHLEISIPSGQQMTYVILNDTYSLAIFDAKERQYVLSPLFISSIFLTFFMY